VAGEQQGERLFLQFVIAQSLLFGIGAAQQRQHGEQRGQHAGLRLVPLADQVLQLQILLSAREPELRLQDHPQQRHHRRQWHLRDRQGSEGCRGDQGAFEAAATSTAAVV
jgi:hypothetical protein